MFEPIEILSEQIFLKHDDGKVDWVVAEPMMLPDFMNKIQTAYDGINDEDKPFAIVTVSPGFGNAVLCIEDSRNQGRKGAEAT